MMHNILLGPINDNAICCGCHLHHCRTCTSTGLTGLSATRNSRVRNHIRRRSHTTHTLRCIHSLCHLPSHLQLTSHRLRCHRVQHQGGHSRGCGTSRRCMRDRMVCAPSLIEAEHHAQALALVQQLKRLVDLEGRGGVKHDTRQDQVRDEKVGMRAMPTLGQTAACRTMCSYTLSMHATKPCSSFEL